MNEANRVCSVCGSPLPAVTPGGRCPQCLLDLAIEAGDGPAHAFESSGRFGDYELIEEIDRGGMGVVFKARQLSLNRTVALKLILSGAFASKEEILRFRAEAEAAANLHHPNIVAIFQTGECNGQHYFSMEHVTGRNLNDIVRAGPLEIKRAARYTKAIADAMSYAHERGTLHRDLKPSNILIDSDDQPRITDFGLAKRLRDDFGLTVTGQVLGSPNFMPPEQTTAKGGGLGPASDVYGIGAVLYHLLTGRPPFQAETVEEVLRALHEREPISPRLLNPAVPRDLETICLRCLEKLPAKRYASALELAADLSRFLSGEAIYARPVRPFEKLWRWCRRKPVVAALLLAFFSSASLGISGVLWQWRRAQINASARLIALEEARQLLYCSDMNAAQQAWDAGNIDFVRRLLDDHRHRSGEPDLRGFEWRLLWRWARQERRMVFESKEFRDMHQLQFSSEGAYLAGLRQQMPLIMDFTARRSVNISNMTTNARTLAFRPKTTILVTGQGNGELQWWDIRGKHFLFGMAAHASNITALAFSPDGEILASGGDDGMLVFWNAGTRQSNSVLRTTNAVQLLRFSPDGKRLAALVGNVVLFVDVTTRRMTRVTSNANAYAFTFSPDGRALAIATFAGGQLLDLESGKERPIAASLHNLDELVFMPDGPDGRKVLAWGWNGLMIWDTEKDMRASPFKGFFNMATGLAFTPDGQVLATSGAKSLTLWRVAEPDGLNTAAEFNSANYELLAFSADSSELAFSQRGADIKLCEPRASASTGIELTLAEGAGCGVFSPDGKTLAIGEGHGQVDLWELSTTQLRRVLNGHSSDVKVVAFTHDGGSLLTGSDDGKVLRWNIATGESLAIQQDQGPVRAMALSPDDTILATRTRDVDINLWSLENGFLITNLHGHHADLRAMEFSPDGKLLASADYGGTLGLWDVATRHSIALFQAHTGGIRALAFAPDGRTLATASYDRTARLWNIATGRMMLTLEHPALVANVRFSPDGQFLATTCQDGKVRLWRAASLAEIAAEEPPPATKE